MTEAELVSGHGHFTGDRIVTGPDVGCLWCEQPFQADLLHTRCPGDPSA